jgi:hypothetical protein
LGAFRVSGAEAIALQVAGAKTAPTKASLRAAIKVLRTRDQRAAQAAALLHAIAKETMPADLPPADKQAWPKFIAHADRCGDKISAARGAQTPKLDEIETKVAAIADKDAKALAAAADQLQEMNASFNLQYLALQQQMQTESRQFTMLSNVMKTKHDSTKNAIDNIR